MLRKYHDVCSLCGGEGQLYLGSQDEFNPRICPNCGGVGIKLNRQPRQRTDKPEEKRALDNQDLEIPQKKEE
jgi:DnaJ-class molecular chaperone